jgi:hypothetical protein
MSNKLKAEVSNHEREVAELRADCELAVEYMKATSRDRFDYTEWRRHNLSQLSVEQFALAANKIAEQLNAEQQH